MQPAAGKYLKCVRRANNAAFGAAASVPTAYINYQRVSYRGA